MSSPAVEAVQDVQRVLVVVAHPDDIDFGCAGSVAAWTAAGVEVSYCIITDGDAGGFDPEVYRARRSVGSASRSSARWPACSGSATSRSSATRTGA
jgi:LmbE family N-acetylglucosaminyl deacetylase